jgi:hypothetical protein
MRTYYKVYGITDCPACLHAIAEFIERYPDVEHVFINTDFSPAYRRAIKALYEFPSFPIIVEVTPDGEKLIGGYTDLASHFAQTEQPIDFTAPPIRPYE